MTKFSFFLFMLVNLLTACGGNMTVDNQILVGPACLILADCACPNDYEATCKDNKCLCLKTEVVVITPDAGLVDSGLTGCQSPADCNCGSGPTGAYEATCQNSMCFCHEINQECYALKRGSYIDQLMHKVINLDEYVPPAVPTYSDVPATHPYYAAIEAATELGIIDGYVDADGGSQNAFGPDNPLNRAEGAKVVIVGIDGLKGYTPPAMPSYKDVTMDAWFFVYVEAATQLNLTHGYVHSDGISTGFYGPADVASSCFMDAMMAKAKIPQTSTGISIVIDEIDNTNLIAIEGESDLLSVRYRVFGTSATNPLKDLKVINQPDGEGTAPQFTLGTEDVFIFCAPPSGAGNYTTYASTPINGVAQFNNLNCYDETGEGLLVELAYNVAHLSVVGDILSGQVFRIVLDDKRLKDSQSDVPVNTVRRTKLEFFNISGNPTLDNEQVTIFPFQVKVHGNGPASMVRLVFVVEKYDANVNVSLKLSSFKFYRDSILLNANIFDQNGQDISDSGILETSKFVVSFATEEAVGAGTSVIYSMRATASGVEQGDTFTTHLDFGDDNLPVVGMTAETTPNTARLISLNSTAGLFPYLTDFYFSTLGSRSVIWSDWSSGNHVYSLWEETSSYDFTNGYALGVGQLAPVIITKN